MLYTPTVLRSARSRRPTRLMAGAFAIAVMFLASPVALPLVPAAAATACNFPGHSSWTLGNGTPVESAAWLSDLEVIDIHTDPPTITPATEPITTAAGNIVRADLFVCNSVPGDASGYVGIFQFRDDGPQPDWNSRDKVGFDASSVNTPVRVGRFFQQVGLGSQYRIKPLFEHFETTEATGPVLNVYDNEGSIGAGDVRGPANGGTCGTLAPGQLQAQIAEDGSAAQGVWDNLKGGTIKTLTFDASKHRIKVHLQNPPNKTPLAFRVGDPVTIEDASPAAYNGTWKVKKVRDELTFTTTGPTVSSLDSGGGGTALRYYGSRATVPTGTQLAGWVEICAGTAGAYLATVKFEPVVGTGIVKTVRWASETNLPAPLVANTIGRTKWYQTMPCGETGDLAMWPRVVATIGALPDDGVLAEGPAFIFHVADTTSDPTRCVV
jgi:hypothetical protein